MKKWLLKIKSRMDFAKDVGVTSIYEKETDETPQSETGVTTVMENAKIASSEESNSQKSDYSRKRKAEATKVKLVKNAAGDWVAEGDLMTPEGWGDEEPYMVKEDGSKVRMIQGRLTSWEFADRETPPEKKMKTPEKDVMWNEGGDIPDSLPREPNSDDSVVDPIRKIFDEATPNSTFEGFEEPCNNTMDCQCSNCIIMNFDLWENLKDVLMEEPGQQN